MFACRAQIKLEASSTLEYSPDGLRRPVTASPRRRRRFALTCWAAQIDCVLRVENLLQWELYQVRRNCPHHFLTMRMRSTGPSPSAPSKCECRVLLGLWRGREGMTPSVAAQVKLRYLQARAPPLPLAGPWLAGAAVSTREASASPCERRLFHGTDAQSALGIDARSFSRYHSGRHGARYGRGVYFARNASVAAHYARPDVGGVRHVYLARVLTGNACLGLRDMTEPPAIDGGGGGWYDSTCSPDQKTFVVYGDADAYAEYRIVFRMD